MKKRACP